MVRLPDVDTLGVRAAVVRVLAHGFHAKRRAVFDHNVGILAGFCAELAYAELVLASGDYTHIAFAHEPRKS